MTNSSLSATSNIAPDFSDEDMRVLVEYFELLIQIEHGLKQIGIDIHESNYSDNNTGP